MMWLLEYLQLRNIIHHVFKETNSLVCTIKIKIDSDNSLIGHLIS